MSEINISDNKQEVPHSLTSKSEELSQIFKSTMNSATDCIEEFQKKMELFEKDLSKQKFKQIKEYYEFKAEVYSASKECFSFTTKVKVTCNQITDLCSNFEGGRISPQHFISEAKKCVKFMENAVKHFEQITNKFDQLNSATSKLDIGLKLSLKSIVMSIGATILSFMAIGVGVCLCVGGVVLILNPTIPIISQCIGLLTANFGKGMLVSSCPLFFFGINFLIGNICATIKNIREKERMKNEMKQMEENIQNIRKQMNEVIKSVIELSSEIQARMPDTFEETNQTNDILCSLKNFVKEVEPGCDKAIDASKRLMDHASTTLKSEESTNCCVM